MTEYKFCKDCKHYKKLGLFRRIFDPDGAKCLHVTSKFSSTDTVTGKTKVWFRDCSSHREWGACGTFGNHFEKR